MAKILKDERIKQRRVTVTFTAHELLVLEAMRTAGVALSVAEIDRAKPSLRLRQESEGSPSYPVDRWNASIEIVQELDD